MSAPNRQARKRPRYVRRPTLAQRCAQERADLRAVFAEPMVRGQLALILMQHPAAADRAIVFLNRHGAYALTLARRMIREVQRTTPSAAPVAARKAARR